MKIKTFQFLFLMACLLLFLLQFPVTRSEIVTETSTDMPIKFPNQENAFIWNGRAFVFYQDGASFYYRHRTNLTTWSPATEIRSVYASRSNLWSVWLEKNGSDGYLHYACSAGYYNIYYRKGQLQNDGSISWSASEQTITWSAGESRVKAPYICTDSDGYPIITATSTTYPTAAWTAYMRRSSTKNGSWTTDLEETWTGVGVDPDYHYHFSKAIPLQNRKFAVITVRGDGANRHYYWNLTHWYEAETNPMTGLSGEWDCGGWYWDEYADQWKWSAVAETNADVIHLVYNRVAGIPPFNFFQHRMWNTSDGWSDLSWNPINYNCSKEASPQLQIFEANNNMRCTWLDQDTDRIYYMDWNTTHWTDPAIWMTETQDISLDKDTYLYADYAFHDFSAIYSDDTYWAITYRTNSSIFVEFLSEPPDLSETQIILSVSSSPEINAPFSLNSTEYSTPETLNFTQEEIYLLTATFSVTYASNTYEFSHMVVDGTAYYTMSRYILMNVSHTVVLHYNLKATPPPIPYIYSPLDPNMTFYMRSDIHTINDLLGYKLADTNTDTEINDTRTYSGSHTITYGVRVWIMDTSGDEDELTSGSPVATVTRSGDGSGIQSDSWNSQDYLSVIDAVVVRLYQRWDSEAWSLRKIFVSHDELLWRIPTCTWTFYYYTTLQNGNTSIFSFGSSTFNSRTAFQYERINPFETQAYYLAKLDLFAFTFTPWTYHIGDLFWGLMLLFMLVTTYNRYHSIKPVIAVCWLFGGAGGVLSTMIPATALQLSWLLLAFALAATLFRMMR